MIELLSSEDKLVKFEAGTVVRIRAVLDGEEPGRTRVDARQTYYVQQIPRDVAAKIALELPTLAKLRLPDGEPVWLDAAKAEGPVHVAAARRPNSARSGVVIGGRIQPVSNTDREVAEMLATSGGTPSPIPPAGVVGLPKAFLRILQALASERQPAGFVGRPFSRREGLEASAGLTTEPA